MNQNENVVPENRKYIFTGETTVYGGRILHRICAVRDFGDVKSGDLGGWIESEKNLSHHDNTWVYDDAKVGGNALVCGNAKVCGNALVCDALVYDEARVCGNALVLGDAMVYGDTTVYGNAEVFSDARVYGNATVYGHARVFGDAKVYGDATVYGHAWVYGHAKVCGNANVYGNANVFSDARVYGNTWVYGNARVNGDAEFCGAAAVYGNAVVCGGKWEVSPCYIQGSIWSVSIASPDEVQCGGQRHTWKEWHDNYRQISREHNADHVLQEYVRYFNLLCDMYGHEDYKIMSGEWERNQNVSRKGAER